MLIDYAVETPDPIAADNDGALWSFAHRKFKSNIGFLVEAIVEGIPQAIIQITAVVVYGEADFVLIVSILMSVFVVASKGYMLAYSIDGTTFVFNSLCVAADVCALFATIVWVYGTCSVDSLVSPEPFPLYQFWLDCACNAVLLTGIGGLFLALFANSDDHLKVRLARVGRLNNASVLQTGNEYFDLWFVRTLTWVLALLPASVMVLSFKATALPLLYFKSFEPAHFEYPAMHCKMFAYINRGGAKQINARLYSLNTLLYLLSRGSSMQRQMMRQIAMIPEKESLVILRKEIANLGLSKYGQSKLTTDAINEIVSRNEDHRREAERRAVRDPLQPRPNLEEEMLAERHRMRWENRRMQFDRDLSEFERRSAIWRFFKGVRDPPRVCVGTVEPLPEDLLGEEENALLVKKRDARYEAWQRDGFKDRVLRIFGLLFGLMFTLTMIAFVPIMIGLAMAGIVIPIVGPVRFFFYAGDLTFESLLGLILSFVYFICLTAMAYIGPRVWKFQSVAKDVFDISFIGKDAAGGDTFYQVVLEPILDEAFVRFRVELGKEKLREFLEKKSNPDAVELIFEFVRGAKNGMVPEERM